MSDVFSSFRLHGKRALVTGGSRGIGGAIASALADAGADVTVVARSVEACEAKAKELGGHGRAADVCDEAAMTRILDEIEAAGGVDILVCAAGGSHSALALATSDDDLRRMFDQHLHGALFLARRCATAMKERGGGSVLFVASVWGLGGQPGTLAYGTAKAALLHATKVMGIEWARHGVRVNAIAPGFVDTAMTEDLGDAIKDKLLSRVPMRRAARPDEMAGPALLLCSDAGSYITGQVIVVDGGERAR